MEKSSSFLSDDQTDEDFFDKLVDDEFDDSKHGISKVLSDLSLGDVSESDLIENGTKEESLGEEGNLQLDGTDHQAFNSAETVSEVKNDVLKGTSVNEVQPAFNSAEAVSEFKNDAAKGISVKEVQWSAFSVASEPFVEGDGLSADFLIEKSAVLESKSDFLENPVDNASLNEYALSNGQNLDQNDPQYWESQYPGWKYDAVSGQWYQVDGYGLSADTANTSGIQACEVLESSGSMEVSYLQTASQPVLETMVEDCKVSTVSNWNQDSHGSTEYPSNMVFDPQYPEWYYDTNTQQWYTLESYTGGISNASDIVVQEQQPQDPVISGGISLEESDSFYGDPSQTDKQSVQSQNTQEFAGNWKASENDFTPQNNLYSNGIQTEQLPSQVQNSQEYGRSLNGFEGKTSQSNNFYANVSQSEQFATQGWGVQQFGSNLNISTQNYSQPKMWQPELIDRSASFSENQQVQSNYNSMSGSQIGQQQSFKSFEPAVKHNYGTANGISGANSFVPKDTAHHFNQPKVEKTLEMHLPNSYYGDQNSLSDSYYGHQTTSNNFQQSFQGANASHSQFPYAPHEGRSSAGRPPHALVTFGFGGKLIVMKAANSFGASLDAGTQGVGGGAVSILGLSDVVAEKSDGSGIKNSSCSYFSTLCQQPFPGPLVGGNVAAKDVNKWLDERIMNCESSSMDFRKAEYYKLLMSLMKILCQHYGKLRSFGTDPSQEDVDGPESAVTKLFASARKNGARLTEYGSVTHCMKDLPSEGQIRATAIEVQNLLVSGRRKEALEYAQEGQLWGPALVLAAQLGEKFYVDTVKKMAHRQFVSGSPLRTLCLLIAGQQADVFSADSSPNSFTGNALQGSNEILANAMLDDWEENLSMITANRTKDDELVIVHLGDCLLKERREITAAHTCYLVAEKNFEAYSDSSRLCLIGADHWKCPRTFASPEAIQRTEVYEYSKVLGNPQFVLLPFQPYKLVYAYMLAEVGKISESLRYCQVALKLLKNPARAPEVEMWKTSLSSLEERLRTHQQGGYSSNIAPLMGKLFTSIDRSINRMMGAPPPSPLPPIPKKSANGKENFAMASSHSTMAMSSLMPAASVEATSEWAGDDSRKAMHGRSASEPNFAISPKQNPPKAADSNDAQSKVPTPGEPSRIGRIGSQLFQKTIGWVSRSRSDRQAKLGDTNKFYYDEKLKRWVEEGAELPAEEPALPPPPTAAAFQNGSTDYNINTSLKGPGFTTNGMQEASPPPFSSEPSAGIPPIPPSQNQFSARARMGVRSRYVDTFNKGGVGGTSGSFTNSFNSPSPPLMKPAVTAKFFVPASPGPSDAQTVDTSGTPTQEPTSHDETSTSVAEEKSFFTPPPSLPAPPPASIQRYPSMDNISPFGNKESRADSHGPNGSFSRSRAASWSGTYTSTPHSGGLGGSPPPFLQPSRSNSSSSLQRNDAPYSDELHEVEL